MTIFRLDARRSLHLLPVYVGAAWIVLQAAAILLPNFGVPVWVFRAVVALLVLGLLGLLAAGAALRQVKSRARDLADLHLDEGLLAEVGERVGAAPGPAPATRRRRAGWAPVYAGAALLLGAAAWQFGFRGELPGLVKAQAADLVISSADRILVAEFEDRSPRSPALGLAVREALVADLSQSERMGIVERSEIVTALRAMQRPDTATLSTPLALELARREGYPAVVVGNVAPLGEGYIFTAGILEGATGRLVVRVQERARNEREALDRVSDLSRKVRQHLGETLLGLRRSEPLPRVTTPSLEALELYAQAVRAYATGEDVDRSLLLLREAIARDTAFANAFYLAYVIYRNTAQAESARTYLERAADHGDRLAEATRYSVQGHWAFQNADLDDARQYFTLAVERDPIDVRARTGLANIEKIRGNDSTALRMYREILELSPGGYIPHFNLYETAVRLGDRRLADSVIALIEQRFPGAPSPQALRFHHLYRLGRLDSAEVAASRMVTTLPKWWRGYAKYLSGALMACRGRMREGKRWIVAALSDARAVGAQDVYYRAAFVGVLMNLAHGRPSDGATFFDSVSAVVPPESVSPVESRLIAWGYRAVAEALAGNVGRARKTVAEMESLEVDERRLLNEDLPQAGQITTARAALALAEGRHSEAIARLAETSTQNYGVLLPHQRLLLAQAFEGAGRMRNALAQYDTLARFARTPVISFAFHAPIVALAHERLGELYEQMGDVQRARYHYGQFVALWERAEPEVQPRVAAAQRALARLTAEGNR